MLTTNRSRLHERRGIALILILGMLGLLAFIGVTFATISGQARVGARNYAQSVMRPQPAELMEYALSQLIGDTDDVRSAIRGHSMARDAYGNDAYNNGYIPDAGFFRAVGAVTSGPRAGTIQAVTSMPAATVGSASYYGYDFTRWVVRFDSRFDHTNANKQETRAIGQTFEILYDDPTGTLDGGAGTYRTFYLAPPEAKIGIRGASNSGYTFRSPDVTKMMSGQVVEVVQSNLIGESPVLASTGVPLRGITFTLDGRFLRAFNGPGMGLMAQYANMRYNGGLITGKYDGGGNIAVMAGEPNVAGMDEDYDACDLENWFLAIQSADGKVVVPSFHRPGILTALDWTRTTAASRSKILRPRMIDGHDPVAFRNLTPDPNTGRIEFDVDNDADGMTDSVWVDLGYPPVRDVRGFWYKPLFAFLVVGLNGKIPLNTAGNLQLRDGSGAPLHMHASHLGYSPSEIDPSFGLQNASFSPQLDDAFVSANVTQLRNILAGTRPYAGVNYADQNFINGYPLPNGVADAMDAARAPYNGVGPLPPRAVPGRWGEPGFIANFLDYTNTPGVYTNLVRAGASVTGGGALGTQRADGRDDDYTGLDFWPIAGAGEFMGASPLAFTPIANWSVWSKLWPADYYDAAGDTPIFAERARRFVSPLDVAGDGRVVRFGVKDGGTTGPDVLGRVVYQKYYRPPGVPVATVSGMGVPTSISGQTTTVQGAPSVYDVTNNPLHGFEAFRNPSSPSFTGWPAALHYGATPTSDPAPGGGVTTGGLPYDPSDGSKQTPTYSAHLNSEYVGNPGLNEADETDLYNLRPTDSVFGFEDLEWLYRAHDQDGTSLYSRLSELAPLSFSAASDALRRRRLYSIDVWETNAFSWTNDNPYGNFTGNSTFAWPFNASGVSLNNPSTPLPTANASLHALHQTGVNYVNDAKVGPLQSSAPSLVHRDRKINLNFPLPVSNETTEPTRVKWVFESYQFLKTVLPPLSLDTPEEKAMLSQFLVNVVDFRDPDATMTRFVNPDVYIRPASSGVAPILVAANDPTLNTSDTTKPIDQPLVQFGMEYNPIAINEVLAYSFRTRMPGNGSEHPVSRFYIELVNTLTAANTTEPTLNASALSLGGFGYQADQPYKFGAWDLIFTDDAPHSRPEPFTGQLPIGGTGIYSPTPLNRDTIGSPSTGPDVVMTPLASGSNLTSYPSGYFYTLGNAPTPAAGETGTPPAVTKSFVTSGSHGSFDPMVQSPTHPNPGFASGGGIRQGVLPQNAQGNWVTAWPGRLPAPTKAQDSQYKWVCLRRPANPFQAVSATNPMVVVDAMRFPFIEGTGPMTGAATKPDVAAAYQIYSSQRFQPYRGGHLVPQVGALDVTRYGFSDQITGAKTGGGSMQGVYNQPSAMEANLATRLGFSHSLGQVNTLTENWDQFTFNDRDFLSPAELMLVPGCPPGLFTKLFVDAAPTRLNIPKYTSAVVNTTPPIVLAAASAPAGSPLPTEPHTYPYLQDRLFYSSASPARPNNSGGTGWNSVHGPSSGGWHKMFEVFEVPSTAMGAIGPAAEGVNFDWLRQDVRPGQINLNLIIDEEVFLGLMGNAGDRTDDPPTSSGSPLQQVVAVPSRLNGSIQNFGTHSTPRVVTQVNLGGDAIASYPIYDPLSIGMSGGFTAGVGGGPPALKKAFCDFLSIRHGATGHLSTGAGDLSYSNMFFGTANPRVTEAPFRSLSYPDIDFTIMRPAFPIRNQTATNNQQGNHGVTARDPGVKNQGILYKQGTRPYLPPAIPPRRLFAPADTNTLSNAAPVPDPGRTPSELGYRPLPLNWLEDGNVNLTDEPLKDLSQNPYYRSEWLQKLMNLSTVRTHQYAVWVTVGFFEVTTLGDPSMAIADPSMAIADPDAAYDVLGREVGTTSGRKTRHRGFFIVDRLKLNGFDPRSPGQYKDAVLYRRVIQ